MRAVAAALAVVVAAFLAARLHDDDRCDDARRTVFSVALGSAPQDELEQALGRIRESCRGTTALVSAAGALHARGEDERAADLAREATEEEPDSAAAWRALAETAQAPAEARAAERRFSELDPLGARSFRRRMGRSTR